MLAFLFWNWPEGAADRGAYEGLLAAFHQRLRSAGIPGLVETAVYRVAGLPWLPVEAAYEDWYVVHGFADLEALNVGAVAGDAKAAHDAAAAASSSGAGALYGVQSGALDLDAARATWLVKPRGTPYEAFYATLPTGVCVLRRQLVLGPAPEFCLLGEAPGGLSVARQRIV